MSKLVLDGKTLTMSQLMAVARGGKVDLAPDGLDRMQASRALVDRVIADGTPVYGVTTGLGARANEALDADTLAAFSYRTLRGRAHAIGPAAAPEIVRAAMVVRLNTLLTGYSGAQVAVAEHLAACLNAGVTPVVGDTGSIGAGDLVLNATLGLALIGEGQMAGPDGQVGPSDQVMTAAGIAPLELGPRDGLALANHTGWAAGAAAVAWQAAKDAFEGAQKAAALSLEGFRANLTPMDARALAVKPLPGQQRAAAALQALLEGSQLREPDRARRLQDPLSLRNIAQIHGGVQAALDQAQAVIEIEINGASDNPIALVETAEMISCGGYMTTELGLAIEGISRAYVHLGMAQLARIAKMLDPKFSDLPMFLARASSGSNGFAPVMKVTEARVAELVHAAAPVPIWPSVNANGVEDCLTASPASVKALAQVAKLSFDLSAIELMVAAQAVELRGDAGALGTPLAQVLGRVRAQATPLEEDRPLGADIMRLSEALKNKAI